MLPGKARTFLPLSKRLSRLCKVELGHEASFERIPVFYSCLHSSSLHTAALPPSSCPPARRWPHCWQQTRGGFFGGDCDETAKQHHERRLLGYTQQQLFDVVSQVEHYREFVPWCQRSVVLQKKGSDFVEAELEVGFKMFVERYTSQVYLAHPTRVESKATDSTLFDHLNFTWHFKPGPTPNTCWVTIDVDFAFRSPLYRHVASIFFDEVVKRMMNAFEGRCKSIYGDSQKRKVAATA